MEFTLNDHDQLLWRFSHMDSGAAFSILAFSVALSHYRANGLNPVRYNGITEKEH